MLRELEQANEERVRRQINLLNAKVIDPSDLVMLRLKVLTELFVPEILKGALQQAYVHELDNFLDGAEAEYNRSLLTKDVKVPADPTTLTRS